MRENNLYSQAQHMYELHRYKSLCKIDSLIFCASYDQILDFYDFYFM